MSVHLRYLVLTVIAVPSNAKRIQSIVESDLIVYVLSP